MEYSKQEWREDLRDDLLELIMDIRLLECLLDSVPATYMTAAMRNLALQRICDYIEQHTQELAQCSRILINP